jgi:hypothetical protein
VYASGEELDPYALLSGILPHIKDTSIPLVVSLTDGTNLVEYQLSVFLRKNYEVVGHTVKLGFKKLDIRTLKASILYKIEVIDDSSSDNNS